MTSRPRWRRSKRRWPRGRRQQPPGSEVLRAAIALSAGGSEMVVKRALAVEMVLHALTADRRPHKVDYRLATIRPDANWPLRASDGDGPKERPPLAGASLHHFGGFMRASWRLHDWMWGRLDGARRVVDMLLDSAQLERLAGGANPDQAVASLAARLARVCVPSGEKRRLRPQP